VKTVGARERRAYREDGVVCVRGLVSPSWVRRLRAAVEEVIADPSPYARDLASDRGHRGRFFVDVQLWRRPEFRAFLGESAVTEAAARLLGSSTLQLYNDRLLVKEPRCEAPTHWHQDLPYFHLQGEQGCSLWISLDAVDASAGAVRYIRGSHRWGQMYFTKGLVARYENDRTVFAAAAEEVERNLERHDVISFDLEPGDCLFHHFLTLHGAGGNARPRTRRRAYSVRFAGDDVSWLRRPYSPTKTTVRLKDGAKLKGESFPRVWPRAS
jgi:ectoine hydroxylase-related dioxygenase (phytanoyl-CoA dioxygenase family)